jgi:molybdenum cofactor guanylyltransferase
MKPLTVLILAGGRSTRMGQDKAWLELAGVPLVERVARRLLPLAAELVFSARDPAAFDELIARLPVPARVVVDEYPGAGPLAGLHAGLRAAAYEDVLAVATDMPFVDANLVERMVAACRPADAIIPRLMPPGFDAPQPEPLHALYRKSCLPAIEAALNAGRRRLVSFLQDVDVCYLDEDVLRQIDPELKSFRNVNTPEEWAQAEKELAEAP